MIHNPKKKSKVTSRDDRDVAINKQLLYIASINMFKDLRKKDMMDKDINGHYIKEPNRNYVT